MASHFFRSESFFEQHLIDEFKVVDKTEFIINFCKDKKVLHIGCCDWPIMDFKTSLHAKLISATKETVGIDSAVEGLQQMRIFFKNLRFESDINSVQNEPFEVVIIPDVIEHVHNTGSFLETIRKLNSSVFIFSAPNAFSEQINKRLIENIEEVHPDHKCYYSPYTLYKTLESNGFDVCQLLGYDSPTNVSRIRDGKLNRLKSHGIMAVCRTKHDTTMNPAKQIVKSEKPLSILHTVEFYHPHVGGAETVIQKISEMFVKRGHNVTVATTKLTERNYCELNGVQIEEFNVTGSLGNGISGADTLRYQEFLSSGQFDVMMNYAAQQWATDLAFNVLNDTKHRRANIIAPCGYSALADSRTVRWPQFHNYFTNVIPKIMPLYDAAVYHSGLYKDYEFAKNQGFQNSVIIPNGVDEEEFLNKSVFDFREKYHIKTRYLGLCVANFYPGKGHDRVIECVRQMNRQDFTMVFVGKEGEQLPHLRALSNGLNIKYLVNIPREDTVAAYHSADIFLFGSEIEASPLVVIEAKASKTPFVSTDCGNVREWKGGIVCLPNEMAPNAVKILDNEKLHKQLAEEGYQEWKEKLTWNSVVNKYEELYIRLSNAKQSNSHTMTTGQGQTGIKKTRENEKLCGIIFSKDRPLQLDGALKSFFSHCKDADKVTLNVLYKSSTPVIEAFYQRLSYEYPSIEFIKETNFKADLLRLIDNSEYMLFLVDDNIFVKDFDIKNTTDALNRHQDAVGFSLRLGKNTNYCYPLNKAENLPRFHDIGGDVVKFDWTSAELDFNYPLEVSSSVYRTKQILPLLSALDFKNPNTLEALLAANTTPYREHQKNLVCFKQSVTFCAPLNMVQDVCNNRICGKPEYSVEKLLRLFMDGYRIDIAAYSGFTPNACHQEVELKLHKTDEKRPAVSVIIPCYNQANFLPDAVESVVNQTFTDWECIIVNDGSPDNTREVAEQLIERYKDKRIRLINQQNQGLARSRNNGIALSGGRYILPLDSDDKLHPDMLQRTASLLESQQETAIAYTDLMHFYNVNKMVQASEYDFKELCRGNQLNYCSLYRREAWEAVGGYNPNMNWGYEDWDFWIGCGEKGYFGKRIPEPLLYYRVKETSMFTKALQHDEELKARIVLNHPALYDVETMKWTKNVLSQEAKPKVVADQTKTEDMMYEDTQSLISKGRYDEAIGSLEKLITLNPGYATAHNDLGVLYYNKGDKEKALLSYEKAVELNPQNTTFLKNLADFYYAVSGRTEEALRVYQKISEVNPDDTEALLIIGNILAGMNRFEEAKRSFVNVMKIEPGNKDAWENMAALQQLEQGDHITAQQINTNIGSNKRTDSPEISVIVPTYNRPDMLVETLKSILHQTYQDFEIIVVNDAGGDVDNVINSLDHSGKIVYIKHQLNKGLAGARNTGIKAARGKYIAYLDDDDLFYPDHLETLVSFLKNSDYKVAYTDAYRAHQEKRDGKYFVTKRDVPYSYDFDYDRILVTNFVPVLCFMHEKSCIDEVGPFDESLKRLEDWDMWIRLSRKFKFYHIKKITCEFNWRNDGSTMTSGKASEFVDARKSISEKYSEYLKQIPAPVSNVMLPSMKRSVVSIVILTFNQLKYTKECVESIRKHTPEPHEVIFVDNGSTDGTVKWLRQLVKDNQNYKLIENKKNLGFSKGCNQGIGASSGEYILLLNNDVVVTEGWLSGMLECLNRASDTGIVGPMTNNISGIQKIIDADYGSIERLDGFARSFRENNRHRRIPSRRVVGFCMLFRRNLVEKIGLLDESFGSGNFEDDDYCLRAALADYKNIIAGDVFIHHYGSMSFKGNRIDYGSAMARNNKVFTAKWGCIDVNTPIGKKLLEINAMEKADELYQKEHLNDAVTALVNGIKLSPGEKGLYHSLAGLLIDARHFEEALRVIDSMPEDIKKDIRSIELIGYCKEGMGQHNEAEEIADHLFSLNADSAPALNLKGIIAYNQGDRKTAENFFNKAIESDPGYGEPYTNLGVIMWSGDKKEEGLALLEKGFILSPTVTDMATSFHSAITNMERFDHAEKLFQDALKLHPYNKRLKYMFIDTLLKQNKHALAMKETEEAMTTFGIDDGVLSAALEIRNKVGAMEIKKASSNKTTISLCMIVKNEEQYLAKCIMSAKPVVDEIIVVDTGSTDRTTDIATAFGAKVSDIEWTNNFSDARNLSLSKASGDWILVFDADEVLSSLDYGMISTMVEKKGHNHIAYSLTTRNYVEPTTVSGWVANDGKYSMEETGTGWYPSKKVRLFPNDSRIRFENHVHELVEPSLKRLDIKIKDGLVPIHHYGKLNMEKVIAKGEEYYALGKAKLNEKGDDLKSISELAVQAGEIGKYEDAIELWQRVINLDPNSADAFHNMGFACLQTGKFNEALYASKRAAELKPGSKEPVINYSIAELCAGDANNAIHALENLLKKIDNYPVCLALLSIAYLITGNKEREIKYTGKLQKMGQNLNDYIYDTAKKLMTAGRIKQALMLLDSAIESKYANDEILSLHSKCLNIQNG